MGKRGQAAFGAGTWALPGGHLEFMKTTKGCIARKLKEEIDLDVSEENIEHFVVTDDLQPEDQIHYLHIAFKVSIDEQELKIMEPESCEEWRWFNLNELPDTIFPPHQKIFKTIEESIQLTSQK